MSYLGTVVTTTPALYWLPQLYEIQMKYKKKYRNKYKNKYKNK